MITGTVAALLAAGAALPDTWRAVNAWGIPSWIPLALALVAAGTAIYSAIPRWPYPALAAFWGLAALLFARPGLLALGIDPLPAVPLAVLPAAACFWFASRLPRGALRRALAVAAALPAAVLAGLYLAAPSSDALTYTFTAAGAALALRAAYLERSRS